MMNTKSLINIIEINSPHLNEHEHEHEQRVEELNDGFPEVPNKLDRAIKDLKIELDKVNSGVSNINLNNLDDNLNTITNITNPVSLKKDNPEIQLIDNVKSINNKINFDKIYQYEQNKQINSIPDNKQLSIPEPKFLDILCVPIKIKYYGSCALLTIISPDFNNIKYIDANNNEQMRFSSFGLPIKCLISKIGEWSQICNEFEIIINRIQQESKKRIINYLLYCKSINVVPFNKPILNNVYFYLISFKDFKITNEIVNSDKLCENLINLEINCYQ